MDWLIWAIISLSASGMIVQQDCWTSEYGGRYEVDFNRVIICADIGLDKQVHVLFHELWHHYWYTVMTQEEKQAWYDLWLWYITEYAKTNATEDFAEVFRFVVYDERKGIKRKLPENNIWSKYFFVQKLLSKYTK